MAHNKYYVVSASDPDLKEIESIIVGFPDNQRYSIDGNQIVIKLHEHDHKAYPFLSDYPEQNHDSILLTMNTPEWSINPMLWIDTTL